MISDYLTVKAANPIAKPAERQCAFCEPGRTRSLCHQCRRPACAICTLRHAGFCPDCAGLGQ